MTERTYVQNATGEPKCEADEALLMELYRRLYARYGPQHWWPGESQLETVIGAILTQATAWGNVEKALANLRAARVLSAEGLRDVPEADLAGMLRPALYFDAKARKVKAFIGHLWDRHGGDLKSMLSGETSALRHELLSIHGIGEETADDIILYAGGKPSFVIDSYTRRILQRLGLTPSRESYRAYQDLFHQHIPMDPPLFNEYHALFDRHAKETCKKRPVCATCCLLELCPTGRSSIDTHSASNL